MKTMTNIRKINHSHPEKNIINEAAKIINDDGIVVSPTETRYGVLAKANNPRILKKLFELKGRDFANPCAIFINSRNELSKYAFENNHSGKIADAFLPGPLTLVLKNNSDFPPPIVTNDKIGLRYSSSPVIHEILTQTKTPLTATSANISGYKESETIEEIFKIFGAKVDLYLDSGALKALPSTVIECIGDDYKILRLGAILEDEIKAILE